MACLQFILLVGLISYLFYHSIYAAGPLLLLVVPYGKNWIREQEKKQKQQFQYQFKDSLQSLAAALNVGYSVENAMKETRRDLGVLYSEKSRIMLEFAYMIRQLNMNLPVDKVLEEWADRIDVEEVRNFVTVFVTAKKVGGDSIQIIHNASRNICDKIDIKREIETMMTAKQLEFKVMITIPIFILFYMRISFPEFMGALYGNIVGVVLMTGCLLIYGLAYLWGRRIVDIEI